VSRFSFRSIPVASSQFVSKFLADTSSPAYNFEGHNAFHNEEINSQMDTFLKLQRLFWLVTVLGVAFLLPTYAQEGDGDDVAEATIQITCLNANGEEVNSGIGTATSDDATLILTDRATSEDCTMLGAQLFLSSLSPQALAELGIGIDSGGSRPTPPSTNPENPPLVPAGGATYVSSANTPGQPVGPAQDISSNCSSAGVSNQQVIASSDNAIRINAFLPAGNYKAILLPVRFQTFDPILFVTVNPPGSGQCSIETSAAREYVLDFSRAGISRQVFGHVSGGSLEFSIPPNSPGLTPVEILVGGQAEADGQTSGEFMLLIEGAKLTPTAGEHIYNLSITNSMLNADNPLGAIVLGVSDFLDPNLQAGYYQDESTFIPVFACEDAGGSCQSDALGSLDSSSVVEAQVRTINGDDRDAAIVAQPSTYLRSGIQEVSYIVSQVNGQPLNEEYVIVFVGGVQ
jgi:hypothetical protein